MELEKKLKLYMESQGEKTDLLQASLLLAKCIKSDLDTFYYMDLIEEWVEQIESGLRGDESAAFKLAKINQFLFTELGFTANHDDFYDPANSMINEVIDRRTGTPISLSILYISLGRRMGLPLEAVAFPGHFLVKIMLDDGILVIDPFSKGVSLDKEELTKLLKVDDNETEESTIDNLAQHLQTAQPNSVLLRLLRNLKGIYLYKKNTMMAVQMLNLMLTLKPSLVEEHKERGILLHDLECPLAAAKDFEHYLKRRPEAENHHQIRRIISQLKQQDVILH